MKYSFNQLSERERDIAYYEMLIQCNGIHWINRAFEKAWESYKKDNWKFDGATFVDEHNDYFWEVAAFIHDWLNHIGYVGKQPDLYFLKIMIELDYSENMIFERCKWMQWTFFNTFWHWLRGRHKGDDIPEFLK